jgi:hypothetical protein
LSEFLCFYFLNLIDILFIPVPEVSDDPMSDSRADDQQRPLSTKHPNLRHVEQCLKAVDLAGARNHCERSVQLDNKDRVMICSFKPSSIIHVKDGHFKTRERGKEVRENVLNSRFIGDYHKCNQVHLVFCISAAQLTQFTILVSATFSDAAITTVYPRAANTTLGPVIPPGSSTGFKYSICEANIQVALKNGQSFMVQCKPGAIGRHVTIVKHKSTGKPLELCEVEAYGKEIVP